VRFLTINSDLIHAYLGRNVISIPQFISTVSLRKCLETAIASSHYINKTILCQRNNDAAYTWKFLRLDEELKST